MRVSNQKWLKYVVMVAGGVLLVLCVSACLLAYLKSGRSPFVLASLVGLLMVFAWLVRKGADLLRFEKTSVEIQGDAGGLVVITEQDSKFYRPEELRFRHLELMELVFLTEAESGETLAVFDIVSTNARSLIAWCKDHLKEHKGSLKE